MISSSLKSLQSTTPSSPAPSLGADAASFSQDINRRHQNITLNPGPDAPQGMIGDRFLYTLRPEKSGQPTLTLSLSSQPAFVYLQLKDFLLKHLHDADRLVPAFQRDAAQYPQGALVAQVLQAQYERVRMDLLRDKPADSGELGSLQTQLVTRYHSSWTEVKEGLIGRDDAQMRRFLSFRKHFVDGEIDRLRGEYPGLLAKSVGSADLTSDYDLTLATPGSDGDVKAVAKFNKRVETVFGKQPGTVFDTNLYAKDYLGVSENISLSVKDRVTADPRLKDKAAESPGGGQAQTGALDQDVMSLLKQRRFMPQMEWDRYTEQVVAAMGEPPPTDDKARTILHKKQADVRRQYDEADAIYQSSVFELLGETRKALEKSNPQALAHLTPAALDAAEALALEAEVDALLPQGGKPTISLRETLLAQLRAPKELGAMQHADADLSSKVSGELYLARMTQVRRLQMQIRDADAQALTQPGQAAALGPKLNVLRAQVKKLLGEAIFFAAEAYQSEGALKHVVAGLQGSDEEKAQALGSLSPGEILQSFNEQLGDFLKDIGHYTHEGAPAGKIFYRSSKYLWRLFDAVNEMRTERQGAERLRLPPLKFELAYKPAPEIAGRLDKELVAIRKGAGALDEPQKVKKSEEIVGSLFRVKSAPALQSVVLGLSQEFNSAVRQRVSFGQDTDSVREYHQFRSTGLPTAPKGQTPSFLTAPTVPVGPKLPLPGKSRITGQVAALEAPPAPTTVDRGGAGRERGGFSLGASPKPLSAHSLAPFSLPSQSQSPLSRTLPPQKISPLAPTQGGNREDSPSLLAPPLLGAGGASSIVQFQRFARGRMPDVNPAALRTHLLQIGGRGAAPDSGLRQALAPHLGFDPGGARLHTGPAAAEAARWLQAEAFTIGRDVFFGAQRFDPSSPRGRGLIGHELTHVGQQTGLIGGHRRTDPGTMEREAQQVGERILARPSGRGTLQVGDYQRRYEAVGQDDLDNDELARLERISQEALQRAGAALGRRGTPPLDLGSAAIDIEIDLDRMTDREAAQVWADAIVALFGPEVRAEAATAPANAIQRQLTFDSSWPNADVAGPTHVQVLQGRMSDMNAAFKRLENALEELTPANALLTALAEMGLHLRLQTLSDFVTASKQAPVTFDAWRARREAIRVQTRQAQALLKAARPVIRFFTPYFANPAHLALAKEIYQMMTQDALRAAEGHKRLAFLTPYSDRPKILDLAKRALAAVNNDVSVAAQKMKFFERYLADPALLTLALEVFDDAVRPGGLKAARDWMAYVTPHAANPGLLGLARAIFNKSGGAYARATEWMGILAPLWGKEVFAAVQEDLDEMLRYRDIAAAKKRAAYGERFYAKHKDRARQVLKDVPDVDAATKRMDYLAKWHDQGTDLFQLAETVLKAVKFDPAVADTRMDYLAKWHGEGKELFSLAETVLAEAAHDTAVADTRVTFLKPYVGNKLTFPLARKVLAQKPTVPEAQTRMDTLAKYRYNEDLEKSASVHTGKFQDKRRESLTTASKYGGQRMSTQEIALKAQEETNAVTLGIETFLSDHEAHLSAPAAKWLLETALWDLKKAEALHSLLGPEETPNATAQTFIKSILTVPEGKMARTVEIGKLGLSHALSAATAKAVADIAADKEIDADLLRPVLARGAKTVEALLPTLKNLKKDEFAPTTEALKIGLDANLSVPDSLTLTGLVLDKGLARESAAWLVGDGKAHLARMLTLLGKATEQKKATQEVYEAFQSGLGNGLPFDKSEKIAYLFVGGNLGTEGVAWLLGNGKPHLDNALSFLGQKEITPRAGTVYAYLDAALQAKRSFAEAKALALMRLDNRLAQDDLKWLLAAGITRLNDIRDFLEKNVPKGSNFIASTFRKALDTGMEWPRTLEIAQIVLQEKLNAAHRDWLIGPGKPALDTVLPYLKLHPQKNDLAIDTLNLAKGDVTVPAIIALDAHTALGQTPTIENIHYAVEKAAALGLVQVKNILNILARPKITQSSLTPLLESPNRAKNIAKIDTHLTNVTDDPEHLKFLTENVTLEKPRKHVPTENVKRLDTVKAQSLLASDKALENKHLITRGVTVAEIVTAITDTALKPKTLADVTRPLTTLNETTALLTWMGDVARSAHLKEILETQKRPPAVAKAIQDAALSDNDIEWLTYFDQKPSGVTDNVSAGVGGHTLRMQHFAERHTYKHFPFDEIKAQNSMWPHGTTTANIQTDVINALSPVAKNGLVWMGDPTRPEQYRGGNYVIEFEGANKTGKIMQFYPRNGVNHSDAQLNRLEPIALAYKPTAT